MTTQEAIKNFNQGKQKVEEPISGGYEDMNVRILKLIAVEGNPNSSIDHPYVKKEYNEGKALLLAYLEVKRAGEPATPNSWRKHVEVGKLFKEGTYDIAYYPTRTNKEGSTFPGTLLHDIVHAVKEIEGQEDVWNGVDSFDPEKFKGMIFKMKGKFIKGKEDGKEYVILLTSKQRVKDEEYAKQQAAKKDDEWSFEENADELPF